MDDVQPILVSLTTRRPQANTVQQCKRRVRVGEGKKQEKE